MILNTYKDIFASLLATVTGRDQADIVHMIAFPPQADMGDLAFPCFTLAKEAKKAPQVLAGEIAAQVSENLPSQFAKIIAVGPYVNAFIDVSEYVKAVLHQSVDEKKDSSASTLNNEVSALVNDANAHKGKILLEYMSGNPNKPLHVGHARNVCIGDTLRRSFLQQGYNIETSHYGDDSGVNVGYNLVGHLYYGLPLDPPAGKKFDHYCGEIYLQMRGKDEDPEFKEQLSKTLHAIERDSDPEITRLHKEYVKKCTIQQLKSCWRIGASFTMINWETDILHLNLFQEALGILKQRGHVLYAENGDAKGCWIVDLSSLPLYQKEEKQYAILVKSDGVATYVAKDIAFAMRKLGYLEKNFHFYSMVEQPTTYVSPAVVYSTTSDESIAEERTFGPYNQAITIIDNRQIPPQMVVKSALELLGLITPEKQYTPLGYGVVYLTPNTLMKGGFELSDEEKKLARLPFASRKGWTVTMDDMLDLLHARAYEETQKRNPDKDDAWLHNTAESIAITCFRFFLTKTDISKDITFDIDEVLDMEGETGAYVLYTNARIKAVIEKVMQNTEGNSTAQSSILHDDEDISQHLTHSLEIQLIKKIDELENIVQQVIAEFAPHLLNRYLISACQLFNSYYNDVNVSRSEEKEKQARVRLLQIFGDTLERAMGLLGMQVVERM